MSEPVPGRVSFLEIGSRDGAATRSFFGEVFGWPCRDGSSHGWAP